MQRRCRAARAAISVAVSLALMLCGLLAFGGASAQATCGNEAIRQQQHAEYLPSCRAYELVSPPDASPAVNKAPVVTVGGYLQGELTSVRAAADGERLAYFTFYSPLGVTTESGYYVAARGEASGWQSVSVAPPLSPSSATACLANVYLSAELTAALVSDGHYQTLEPPCGHNEPRLATEEPPGWRNEAELPYTNIFLREDLLAPPRYSLVNRTPLSESPADATPQGASQKFGRVVFSEDAALVPGAPAGEDLYEWQEGNVHLVSVLPGGAAVVGYVADGTAGPHGLYRSLAQVYHAISLDGSRVVFEAEGKLYMRVNATAEPSRLEGSQCADQTQVACTVQIDRSVAGGAGGGGVFLAATGDGSEVFFMDSAEAGLTEHTLAGSGNNLYEYDLASGTLTDLTANTSKVDLLGGSGFAEAPGSGEYHLYFAADGALTAGAASGDCGKLRVAEGDETGTCSIYTIAGASPAPRFVGAIELPRDRADLGSISEITTRVSPDGRYFAFDSAASVPTRRFPSGYNSMPAKPEDCPGHVSMSTTTLPCDEIYLYDSATGERECLACIAGARPTSPTGFGDWPTSAEGNTNAGPLYEPRNVTDGGQVFFQTEESLVPEDKNQTMDVYEYDEGAVHLISSGAGQRPALFAEADESGNNVFFATEQGLVGADGDEGLSVYDARVEGGYLEPPAPAKPCEAEKCKAPEGQASLAASPASFLFSGPGNLVPVRANPRHAAGRRRHGKALTRCRAFHRRARRKRCKRTRHRRRRRAPHHAKDRRRR